MHDKILILNWKIYDITVMIENGHGVLDLLVGIVSTNMRVKSRISSHHAHVYT